MSSTNNLELILDKVKLLKPIDNPPESPGKQWAIPVSRINAAPSGFNVNIKIVPPILFHSVNYISIFEFSEIDQNTKYLDLYVARNKSPYRVKINKIIYNEFMSKVPPRMAEAFNIFIFKLIEAAGTIYVDDHTLKYLKTGHWREFTTTEELTKNNLGIWSRISDSGKKVCPRCKSHFWVNLVLEESKNRTICRNCESRQKGEALRKLTRGFKDYLHNRANQWIEKKMTEIQAFEKYFSGKAILDLSTEDIFKYIKSCDQPDSESMSENNRRIIIKEFFEYCFSNGLVDKNPLE
ncbi:MAG: hypothetical protein A2161_01250 [Candidatus Schekmanbacteria bacterium RBG_13_48_7]|uniref:Core-binding (CB) domain-containing protein n=1 Tax=Candidatus Schekmanbacteria bacterium RBG_13_48_7 TaxID=1817878 RepID=A0A1F7S7J7_9BACT|nr:MAG: hypothetical protein A2161_01250 [Candidatus Schekmanbacteria bacterium RBG_13_48_7]